MKSLCCLLLVYWSLSATAQKLAIEKGKDTIFVASDTLARIPFKLTSAIIRDDAQVRIRVHSSDAVEGIEFELRDEHKAPAKQLNITKLENKGSAFYVYVDNSITEDKIVNLEITIRNNGRDTTSIVPLVLAPPKKEPKEEKKDDKKDDKSTMILKFNLYNDLNIPVYTNAGDTSRATVTNRKLFGVIKKENKIPVFINVQIVEVKQVDSAKYSIRVVTTDNIEFKAILKLNSDYEFLTDDKIYLDGKTGNDYIHAKDILEISKDNAGEKVQTLTPDKPETQFKVPQK